MKSAALTLVMALSLSASALAQQESRNEREYKDEYTQIIFGIRNTLPTGEALQGGTRWGDLVSGGVGIDVQYDQLWRANSWIYGGWYAGIAADSFGGRTLTETDPTTGTSTTFRTKRLDTADVEVGGRLRQNFSGFHLDESVGVGAVAYMKQDLDDRTTGVNKLEFIKTSVNYLIDFGIRLGAPIGKNVDLNLGVAFQLNGAPDAGKDFSTLNFKPMENLIIGLSLDIGF